MLRVYTHQQAVYMSMQYDTGEFYAVSTCEGSASESQATISYKV